MDKITKRFTHFVYFIFLLSSIQSWASSKGAVIQTTVEYTTPVIGFTLDEPYTPVMHYNDSTYFVWVDAKFRPWITQTKNGQSTTVPIDPNPDYAAQADAHHRFSLGIDSTGYIHVTGDMHHYSTFTTAVITPYPVRYQKQSMMYWKSNQPENVSGGFTFAGGVNSKTTMPGGGWMLGRFFTDNSGVLYYSSMAHAYEASNNNGQMAVGLYKYDTVAKTWSAIGKTVAMGTQPNMINVFPVFFWENAGSGGGWFQNYQAQFKFDSSNRLHFAVSANTNSSLAGANRLVYAVSDDAGTTWKRANGNVITGGLPLRGIDNQASTADIVKEALVAPFLDAPIGLAIDKNGKPGVSTNNLWYIWNGTSWSTTTPQNTALPPGHYGYRLPNNNMVLNAPVVSKLIRTASFNVPGIAYDLVSAVKHLDERTMKTTGVIYGVTDNSPATTQSVLRTEIIPAPLPKGWESKNIALNLESYIGEAGYLDGIFTVRSYGTQIEGTNDSFTFVYKPLLGDGVIAARVDLPVTYSYAGVMMRESLASNAKNVGVYINPRPDGKLAQYKVRPTTNATTGGYGVSIPTTPYWLKVERKGDNFTSSISPDQINWTKIETKAIPMNKQIYIGLAVVSNGHSWYSETASFDNVIASVNLKDGN